MAEHPAQRIAAAQAAWQKAGEVSEWLIELVSKTSVLYWSTAGSNPALSVFI